MNVKFHKNRKNTVKLKISCVRCHFVKLTFFSGSNEKFSLMLLQILLITSIALEKCKKECNML